MNFVTTLILSAIMSTGQLSNAIITDPPVDDIVTIAANTEFLSTLVAAVNAGDLADVLQGDGPFTVFAPTNEAFEALPEGTMETLLKPENKQMLIDILTYHVVAGEVMSTDLSDGMMAATVNGAKLKVGMSDEGVMINEAKVTTVDIKASNGVVHVVNRVILPPSM